MLSKGNYIQPTETIGKQNDDFKLKEGKTLNNKELKPHYNGKIEEKDNSKKIESIKGGAYIEKPNVSMDLKKAVNIEKTSFINVNVNRNITSNYFLPKTGGEWEGEEGNSKWKPNEDYVPPEKSSNPDRPYSNPDKLTWKELMDKYEIDGIPFKDGEPDFSEVSKGTVEIEDFTDDRDSNFDQADEALAKERECTPEEVAKWRKENNYTWHECKDCKTMQKVPNEIHANVPHSGGVSEYKSKNKDNK